jgi:hypothetical protein
MALLEYELNVDPNGNSTVTCVVLEVDKNDRIQFKSNDAKAAIVYQKSSPFTDPKAPKAGTPFPVGKKATPAFKVAKTLTAKQRIHFDCGVLQKTKGPNPSGDDWSGATKSSPDGFKAWGSGDGTPPRNG